MTLEGVTVCHLGRFDDRYPRNVTIRRALELAGARVLTIAETGSVPRVYASVIARTRDVAFDLVIVGWPGNAMMPLAYALGRCRRVPVVLDSMTSHWETAVADRKVVSSRSVADRYIRAQEWVAVHLADLLLVDTDQHRKFFADRYALDKQRVARIWVGSDEDAWKPCGEAPREQPGPFRVVYVGSFIPLHGVELIVEAAALVAACDPHVEFVLIGSGQAEDAVLRMLETGSFSNVSLRGQLPAPQARNECCRAHLCLGVFGTSDKTQRVIPNKVFDALAMGRPVLTADTPAIREGLNPGWNVLSCPAGNPAAIAEQVLWAKDNRHELTDIAQRGHDAFVQRFRILEISRQLNATLTPILT